MSDRKRQECGDIWRPLRLILLALVLLSAAGSRSAWAGPGSKLLKDVAAGAAGAALLELGKRAYGAYRDSKVDDEVDPLRECMLAIYGDPKAQTGTPYKEAESYLQSQRRLGNDDATDIAMSSLLDICEAHVSRPYSDLVRAYYVAVNNRANKFYTRYQRRYMSCERVGEVADRCYSRMPAADHIRLPGETAAARRVFCGLSPAERTILTLRSMFGIKFSELGQQLGITSQQAHDVYHNTVRRVQSQLRAACMLE